MAALLLRNDRNFHFADPGELRSEVQRYRSLEHCHSNVRSAEEPTIASETHLKEPSWKELARFFPSRVTYAEISSYLLYKCVYHHATVCSYLSGRSAKDRVRMPIHLQNEEMFVDIIDRFVRVFFLSRLENSTLPMQNEAFVRTLSLLIPQLLKNIQWRGPTSDIARYNFQVAELKYFLKGLIVLQAVVLTGSASSRDVLLHIFAR